MKAGRQDSAMTSGPTPGSRVPTSAGDDAVGSLCWGAWPEHVGVVADSSVGAVP
jgi:hypothetical protein